MPAKKTNTSKSKSSRSKKTGASKENSSEPVVQKNVVPEVQKMAESVESVDSKVQKMAESVESVDSKVQKMTESVESVDSEVPQMVESHEEQQISLDEQFKNIITRIQEFRTIASSLTSDVRKLQKNVTRHVRESNKKNRKRTPKSGDSKRPPSGFAKPALISNDLCQFLKMPSGTEMARTEVTKYLTIYIKEHELQDQANKRRIICDSALKSLLKVNDSDEVTYFNLQRYMKPHFPHSAANKAAAAAAAEGVESSAAP
tara:strand:- start:79 stop:855 length:777 start_codon:yes stop_codon:yes gene_type:complete